MDLEGVFDILHEDAEFVVVNKRSGFLSVPGRGPDKLDSVATRIRSLYPDCIEQPAVHRLDMDTSGLMVVALNTASQRNLSMQFQARQTRKRYIALLAGELEDQAGTIELPFRLDVDNRPFQIYDEVHGKLGITHWEKLATLDGITRVAFTPVTGRTHQLRVHSAHERGLGTPIVGDPLYGSGTGPGQLKLHACDLGFQHPTTGDTLNFHCPPAF